MSTTRGLRTERIKQIRKQRDRMKRQRPMGLLCGLLAFSGVMLVGVVYGHDPLIVWVRALVSALIVGLLTGLGFGVVNLANIEPPIERTD